MVNVLPKLKSISYDGYGEVGAGFTTQRVEDLPEEGYRLIMDVCGIKIEYGDEAGKFYAMKTLEQLKSGSAKLPCAVIEDSPRYSYRGFMLDCARYFFTVAEVKKFVSVMAALKLNKFHWHLTDDQGWRLEIKKYKKLTEVGSYRSSTRNDGKPVSGFYTQEEVKELVAYCAERNIEVIPEIDMPGHFTAAVASYNYLGCCGDGVKVAERFGVLHEIACAGKESTMEFCKDVIREAIELFPSRYFHIGGDEALKYRWLDCPHCQKKIEELGLKNEEELQGRFLSEIIAYLNSFGKTAIIWNDGALGGNITGDYRIQHWMQSPNATKATLCAAEKGTKIIFSPFYGYYLDYPHGMTSMKKVYNYEAENMPKGSIEGVEAPLWTEYVEDIENAEARIYPRLFAFAERAWSEKADYGGFTVRLDAFLRFLDGKLPINYTKSPNPTFIRGKAELIRFAVNIYDKTFREGLTIRRASQKKWKLKYGKSVKKM